jgi:3-hydroxyisobutyrate dehydrogenase
MTTLGPFLKIGFIGTGMMGKSMVRHLINAGHTVHIYTRTKSKAEELISGGAVWMESVAELARECMTIFTMVGFPRDVEDVYFGENGLVENAASGSVLIDMTTTKPSLSKKIYFSAREKGIDTLDAPVSGGDKGAREGTLSVMAGGDKEVFEKVIPIFECFAKKIVYQGKTGSGQHTKAANQIAIASTIMGVCEALTYAQREGLDPFMVLSSIESGAAGSWTMSNLGPRMLKGDFDPGFYVKHFLKDLSIALDECGELGFELPALKLAKTLYQKLSLSGGDDFGTQALFKVYNEE